MHRFPWEPPDEPRHRPDPDDSAASVTPDPTPDTTGGSGGELARVPAPLRNWQVVEIEGEATVIAETPGGEAEQRAPAKQETISRSPIREQIDPVVVVVLRQRRVEATPGEPTQLEVEVVNNGDKAALFEVTVEGWIDERWCGELPVRLSLQPGARRTAQIPIEIPRQVKSLAGEYPLAVVARSPRYPGRVTRLAATLVVNAYHAFSLHTQEPRQISASWFRPAAVMLVTLSNLSNHTASFHLHAYDRRHACDYFFLLDPALLDDAGDRGSRAQITLNAGRSAEIPLEIRPVQLPLLRVAPQVVPFRLKVHPTDEPSMRRSVDGEMTCLPLIGLWHLAGLGVAVVVALVVSVLAGLALLLALRSPASPAAGPPTPAPVVAIVLKMDDLVSGAHPQTADGASQVPLVRPGDVTAPGAPSAAADSVSGAPPVVRADQVTAPGEPLPPAAQTPLQPVVVAPQPAAPPAGTRANLTYAQMFQEIALRFDLNWQMLAATAYVESGFDALALGNQGALGLMQIQPATWQEWAPTVDAADPFDAYSNTLVGAAYLDYLRGLLGPRGYPEIEWMLVAYNWGPDHLLDFLEAGGAWESLDAERRQYALDILQIAATIPAN